MTLKRPSLTIRNATLDEMKIGRLLFPETPERPKRRDDCADVPRPCPFVGCRHNTYLEVSKAGSIQFNHDCEPHEVPPDRSCSLDIAEDGQSTLETISQAMGFSRERGRQIETEALLKLRKRGGDHEDISKDVGDLYSIRMRRPPKFL